jgi:enoyl-CoA hydratase
MTSAGPLVTYERDGRIARLRLNRPDKRNALSPELLADLRIALDAFAADDAARVAILGGNGPSFCAGFDLGGGSASTQSTLQDPWSDRRRLRHVLEVCVSLWESRRPVIAQVHGHCLGGGILLPMCSDIVFAADACVLGWPRLPMGAGFMDGAMSLLIGQRRAKEIALIVGSRISGREAAAWGFANFAVADDELEGRTLEFAERVARAPGSILEIRKASINKANTAFREALLSGADWDALAHADPAVDEYRRLVREHGMTRVIHAFESADDPVTALAQDDHREI